MKKVLFICGELPAKNLTGYQTYNQAFVKSLVSQGYHVSLLVLGDRFPSPLFKLSKIIEVKPVESSLKKAIKLSNDTYAVRPFGFLKLLYRRMSIIRKLVFKLRSRIDHATANSAQIGNWLDDKEISYIESEIERQSPDVIFVDTIFRSIDFSTFKKKFIKILIGHDVFFQRCQSFLNQGKTPVPFVSMEAEIAILKKYDKVIAISESDAELYKQMCPSTPVSAISAPVSPVDRKPIKSDTSQIFYIGSNAYHNVDGLNWFLSEVWPKVRSINPNLVLSVVGKIKGAFDIEKFDGVLFHGHAPDLSEIASESMFAINPVRIGSGMKIKMLDYFNYSLPCVTTPVGALGFPEVDRSPILVCETVDEFVENIVQLAADTDKCRLLSQYAIDFTSNFDAANFDEKLKTLIESEIH